MSRCFAAFALVASFVVSAVGCGTHEPPEMSAEAIEQHRQEMIDVSARERGG